MNLNANSQQGTTLANQDPSKMFQVSGVEAASPLDFIKRNLRTPQTSPETVITPEPTPAPVEVPVEAAPESSLPEIKVGIENPLPPEEEFPDIQDPKSPLEINVKKLRTVYKTEKEEHRKAKETLAAREVELEEYKTGKKIPDTLQAQENEIARLRALEKVVSFKTTLEYQENLAQPLSETGDKLKQIFTDYGIPEDVLEEARGFTSIAKQNQFLSDHFDSTGAMEVKGLLEKEKGLLKNIQAAEKEPETALQKLVDQNKQVRIARQRQEREAVQHDFRGSWVKSIEGIKSEGVFTELIHRPGDTQFNEKIVNPIMQKAATEAGKFLTMLVEDGLTKVRPEVGEFISKMTLLAHSSAINASTREATAAHIRELEQNTTRMNSILRPNIGGSTGATPGVPQARELLTAEAAAKQLSDKISGRK